MTSQHFLCISNDFISHYIYTEIEDTNMNNPDIFIY